MTTTPRKIGILGAGGLGRAGVSVLAPKQEFRLVALADSEGVAVDDRGIRPEQMNGLELKSSVREVSGIGRATKDPVGEFLALNREGRLDAFFLAIPNIPNDNVPNVIRRFAESGFQGVIVDALKRTSAVKSVVELAPLLAKSGITYVTGAGATPGLLTAAANLAAQSFQTVEEVEIYFGVGISNWDNYKATVREDIAHMPGFSVEKVKVMTDGDVAKLLDECNGLLDLVNMEHADDVLLERAGVVGAEKVRVGGLVDTRNAKKPVSTRMRLTGVTFEGKRATHVFTLGDETSMAANVLGPAFGWMKSALELRDRGTFGLFTSADLMPKFVR